MAWIGANTNASPEEMDDDLMTEANTQDGYLGVLCL